MSTSSAPRPSPAMFAGRRALPPQPPPPPVASPATLRPLEAFPPERVTASVLTIGFALAVDTAGAAAWAWVLETGEGHSGVSTRTFPPDSQLSNTALAAQPSPPGTAPVLLEALLDALRALPPEQPLELRLPHQELALTLAELGSSPGAGALLHELAQDSGLAIELSRILAPREVSYPWHAAAASGRLVLLALKASRACLAGEDLAAYADRRAAEDAAQEQLAKLRQEGLLPPEGAEWELTHIKTAAERLTGSAAELLTSLVGSDPAQLLAGSLSFGAPDARSARTPTDPHGAAFFKLVGARPPTTLVPALPPGPVLAATDGSRGRGQTCGWGYATAAGELRNGTVRGDILLAELHAIAELIAATPPEAPVELLVDSRRALAAIRDTAELERTHWADQPNLGRTHRTTLLRIKQLREARAATVSLKWVRGHSGHPLNEAADRMAVLARRAHEAALTGGPLPADVLEQLAANIRDDLLRLVEAAAQHRRYLFELTGWSEFSAAIEAGLDPPDRPGTRG